MARKPYLVLSKKEINNATGLRCFRHFRQNCQQKLLKLGIQSKQQQLPFLDIVFGRPGVSQGILDADNDFDLDTRIADARQRLERGKFLFSGSTLTVTRK